MNQNKRSTRIIFAIIFLIISMMANAESNQKIVIFAAASLTNVIDEIIVDYKKLSTITIHPSYASSSTLAKQIENGAPADIFISADVKWMQYLKGKNVLKESSTTILLNNTLVLIAPISRPFETEISPSFGFNEAFTGKLCTGETESVPAGIYAKEALKSLNWWDKIKSRIVGAQDVRAALVLVERGECDAGIVYGTDAKVSNKVSVVGSFPSSSHKAITYPLSLTNRAKQEAEHFFNYLKSEQAKAVFIKYGFTFVD